MKALFIIALAATLVACAGPQVNPQSSVDTAAKDDVVQLGPNLFQVLRKGEATASTELERSGTVAAAGVCVPKGKTVNVTKKDIGYAPGFFALQLSVLLTFSCE
jgi:hypothetical protein